MKRFAWKLRHPVVAWHIRRAGKALERQVVDAVRRGYIREPSLCRVSLVGLGPDNHSHSLYLEIAVGILGKPRNSGEGLGYWSWLSMETKGK